MPFRRALTQRASLPLPQESGLDHIVVLMMENRSTDHYLGWLPGIDGWMDRSTNGTPDGVFTQPRRLLDPVTGEPLPRSTPDECPTGGPPFDHTSILKLIEWRFTGGEPCTDNVTLVESGLETGRPSRDAFARNLADAFDFDNPNLELPDDPEPPDVHLGGAYCGYIPTDYPAEFMRENAPEVEELLMRGLPVVNPPYPGTLLPPRPQSGQQPHSELREAADEGWFGKYDLRHLPPEMSFR